MTALASRLREVDPFEIVDGFRYCDDVVTVIRAPRRAVFDGRSHVQTKHFSLNWVDGSPLLLHRLPEHRIDNDLAGLLADELFTPGWICGGDVYERLLTGLVLTSLPDAAAAWELFYRNTLRRLEILSSSGARGHHGSLAGFAPVYRRAVDLAGYGSVLEIGSCFGFLALQLALRGQQVTASDISAGTMRLLSAMAGRIGVDLDTLACDAGHVPLPDGSVDVVEVVHLLEHLEPEHGRAVVAESLRLARERVVIAVPFEDEPSAAFGHVRTVSLEDLCDLGDQPGWTGTVFEHHGGWLVLDRL